MGEHRNFNKICQRHSTISDIGVGCIILILVTKIVVENPTPGWFMFMLMGIGYFSTRYLIMWQEYSRQILYLLFILTGLAEAIWGITQLCELTASKHFLFKPTGSFANPGPYAGFLAMVLPIALHAVLCDENRRNRPNLSLLKFMTHSPPSFFSNIYNIWGAFLNFFAPMTVIFILAVLPSTMSRAAWIGAFGGSLWVISKHYHLNQRLHILFTHNRKKVLSMVAIISLAFMVLLAGIYLLKKPSADGRLLIWRICVRIIAEHPLFGVGPEYFSGAYGEAQAEYFASGGGDKIDKWTADVPEYAYNEYLQLGAEYGLAVLGLFLLIAFSPFLKRKTVTKDTAHPNIGINTEESKQIYDNEGLRICPEHSLTKNVNHDLFISPEGAKGSLLSLLLFAFFSYPLSLLSFRVALILLLAIVNTENFCPKSKNRQNKYSRESILRWGTYTSLGALIILSCIALLHQHPKWEAEKKWQKLSADNVHLNTQREELDTYQKIYPLMNTQPEFLFDYGNLLTNIGELRAANTIFIRALKYRGDPIFCNLLGKNFEYLCQYDLAEYWLIKATQMVPNRLYPYYLLANMYHRSGQEGKALSVATYVIDEKPKVASPATNQMKREMKLLRSEILAYQPGNTYE